MRVLGINLSHNASIAIVENGQLLLSLEEERLSKRKKDAQINNLCLLIRGMNFDLVTYTSYNINHFSSEYFENLIKNNLSANNIGYEKLIKFEFHHLTHAFTAFYNSGFKEAICLVIDNGGLQHRVKGKELGEEILSIYKLNYKSYKPLFKLLRDEKGLNQKVGIYHSFNSISPAGVFDMFRHIFKMKEPGSIMGLSAYGKSNNNIPPLYGDNKLCYLNSRFMDLAVRYPHAWPKGKVTKEDVCYRIQEDTSEVVIKYIKDIMKQHPGWNICLSGGYFQNSVANYKFLQLNKNIYVDPICHDGGVSVGLAQHMCFIHGKNKPVAFKNLYQGPTYAYKNYNVVGIKRRVIKTTPKEVAALLAKNNLVAIYQGRSEMGPRALGNRSLLFNPSDPKAKEKVNLIKGREWFRPYAGTVLHEKVQQWFDLKGKKEAQFMSYVVGVREDKINRLPGICHIDNTCRIQTLKKEDNENFYNIIKEFYKITGIPIILNTSLNAAGEPLVETMEDLYNFFKKTKIKYMYLPDSNELILKE